VLKTTWKTEYKGHVIELENRPRLERLIVDGKEIAREPGATWEPRSFQATIPDGNRSMKVDANTRFSKSPRGLRFTVSVDGKEIYSEVKWPPRWYLPFAAVGLILAADLLSRTSSNMLNNATESSRACGRAGVIPPFLLVPRATKAPTIRRS
jgi:hypothetical protein